MTAGALSAVVKGIAPVIREYVAKALGDLATRVHALEERSAVPGERGPQGERGDPGPEGPAGPQGAPGADGRDGAEGPQGVQGPPGERGADGERGLPGADGKDGAPGEPGAIGPAGEPGQPGAEGTPGRDGRDGLPGPAGEKGADGRHGLDGKDGAPGKDGLDGLGFDDIQVEYDGERRFSLKFVQGDRVKEFGAFTLPVMIDRGVFKQGTSYEQGDAVSWGGSIWIAQSATSAKPGESGQESRAWRLGVQRGRDGKAGPPGPKGEFVVVKDDGKR